MYALTRYRIQIPKLRFIVFAPFRFRARGAVGRQRDGIAMGFHKQVRFLAVSFSRLRVFSPSLCTRERGNEMVAMTSHTQAIDFVSWYKRRP